SARGAPSAPAARSRRAGSEEGSAVSPKRQRQVLAATITGLLAVVALGAARAHHAVEAAFDRGRPMTLEGIVTAVDWRNPHAHVFVNVPGENGALSNWAVELESPVLLERSGFDRDSVKPGDAIRVEGFVAHDGTRQIWGESVVATATGRRILYVADTAPRAPKSKRPTPRWEDGTPRLGGDELGGYWGYPSSTVLVERGVNVAMSPAGLLHDLA